MLTRNFDLPEFVNSPIATAHGIDNMPPFPVIANLTTLCDHVLQPLRDKIGEPIIITSGYRCQDLNRLVGGAPRSQHLKGQAADIHVNSMGVMALFNYIINSGIPFDQIIQEFDQWVHISWNPTRKPRQSMLLAQHGEYGDVIYRRYHSGATCILREPKRCFNMF